MENLYTPNKIRTFTGKYINPLYPDPEMICIEDIAHALSMQCRFGGHVKCFYSVAEHSLFCAQMLGRRGHSKKERLAALLHDSSEAYLLDIPAPVKAQIAGYKEAENRLMEIISEKFGIQYPFPEIIKEIDQRALKFEWEVYMVSDMWVKGFTPNRAKQLFLKKFEQFSK